MPGPFEAGEGDVGGGVGDEHVEGLRGDGDGVAAHNGQLVHLLHGAEAGPKHLAAPAALGEHPHHLLDAVHAVRAQVVDVADVGGGVVRAGLGRDDALHDGVHHRHAHPYAQLLEQLAGSIEAAKNFCNLV